MGRIKATDKQLKHLKRKAQKGLAKEQHPESADVIIAMQAQIDKLMRRVAKLEKRNSGIEDRVQKLVADKIMGGRLNE